MAELADTFDLGSITVDVEEDWKQITEPQGNGNKGKPGSPLKSVV
jgi:hypothetical protein